MNSNNNNRNNLGKDQINQILSKTNLMQYLRHYRKFKRYGENSNLIIQSKLIERDVRITTIGDKGHTALFWSCELDIIPFQVVRMIHTAYPQAALLKNNMGWTPLHRAVYHNSKEKILYLSDVEPAAICLQDNYSETPLDLTFTYSLYHISLKFIIKAGAAEGGTSSYLRKHRERILKNICKKFYKPLQRFVECSNNKSSNTISISSLSKEEIFSQCISISVTEEGNNNIITIKDFYNAMHILLQLKYTYDYRQNQKIIKSLSYNKEEDRYVVSYHDNNEIKQNWCILHASLKEIHCPFIFCQLFIYIHPEQVYMNDTTTSSETTSLSSRSSSNSLQALPITYVGKDMKKVYYHYCEKCLHFKDSIQFYIYAADDIICKECKDTKKIKYLVKYDGNRDIERMQFIYESLLICPAILRLV